MQHAGYGFQAPQINAALAPNYAMSAPQNSYSGAQSAIANAGSIMKATKFGLIGIGGLCILGGAVMLLALDPVGGIMTAITGGVLIGIAFSVLPRFAGTLGQASAMVNGLAAKEQLAQTGVPARARLMSVQQTGRLVNHNPEIQAMVEVHHPQLGVYHAQASAIVPQIAIPRAQPGAEVQVRVNPQNQHDIALVF